MKPCFSVNTPIFSIFDKLLPQPPLVFALCLHQVHFSHLFPVESLRCVWRNRCASALINTAVYICGITARISLLCNRDPRVFFYSDMVNSGKTAPPWSTFTYSQDRGPEPDLLEDPANVSFVRCSRCNEEWQDEESIWVVEMMLWAVQPKWYPLLILLGRLKLSSISQESGNYKREDRKKIKIDSLLSH